MLVDESFSQNINFSVDNMESAKSSLSDGKYDSIILIPDQFLNDIISGENKSFKSYMGNISSVEMIALNELNMISYIFPSKYFLTGLLSYKMNIFSIEFLINPMVLITSGLLLFVK